MTRKNFTDSIMTLVDGFIANYDEFDNDPQLRVEPATLNVSIVSGDERTAEMAYSQEALEGAAAVEGVEGEDADDLQVRRNPDFYAMRNLIKTVGEPQPVPARKAIKDVVDMYF